MFKWITRLFSRKSTDNDKRSQKFWVVWDRTEDIGPDSKFRSKHYTHNFHKACRYAKSLANRPHDKDHPVLYKVIDQDEKVLAQWSGRIKK